MARFIASGDGWRTTVKTLALGAALWAITGWNAGQSPVFAEEGVSPAHLHATDLQGYARIVFSFDRLPTVEISQTNGVMVLNFDRPLSIDTSRLGLEIPTYVSAARSDPDKRAVRLALTKAVRANLTEAGNDLYVDLLPVGWKGPLPPLPADVVQTLSRKARLADAMAASGQSEERRTLLVDTASSNRLSRLLFRGAVSGDVYIVKQENTAELRFAGRWTFDLARLRAELPRGFASIAAETRDGALVVTVVCVEGVRLDARIEDGNVVVDAAFKGVGAVTPDQEAATIITGATLLEPTPARSRDAVVDAKEAAPLADEAANLAVSAQDHGVAFKVRGFGKIAVAAFVRANAVWVVLDTKSDPILPTPLKLGREDALDVRTGRRGPLFFIRIEGSTPLYPSVQTEDDGLNITLNHEPIPVGAGIALTPVPGPAGVYHLNAGLTALGHVAELDDPVVGDRIMVTPTLLSGVGVGVERLFPEFEILPSFQGLAVVPSADDLEMHATAEGVVVSRPDGLALTDGNTDNAPEHIARTVINRARWERDKTDNVLERQNQLMDGQANATHNERKQRRLELARFLASNGLYREAAAGFISAFDSRIETIDEPRDRLELGIFEALGSDWRASWDNLSDIRLAGNDEAALWRAYLAAHSGRFAEALDDYRHAGDIVGLYPDEVQTTLRLAFAEAAIEGGDWGLANDMEKALRATHKGTANEMLDYYRARIEEASGALEEAHKAYEGLVNSPVRGIEVRAVVALTALDLRLAQLDPAKALSTYENLAVFWRGDFLEAKLLARAARVALDSKKWRNAFLAVQRLNRLYADTDGVRPLLEEVTLRFDGLIGGDQPDSMAPVDAVALFMEFREFMPTGRRADELIRKYIERLVDLDLMAQATELLRYQIEYRLEGTPRAAAAVRLASLYLIDHKAIEAVRAISETRSNGLPEELRIARRLIEARARSDLGEITAASELLEGLDSREANIVRADIYWKTKNWTLAGENYEAALGDGWRKDEALLPDDLKIALRAAASYVLAGDALARERFRGRYRTKLEATEESGVFRLLTAPANVQKPIAVAVSAEKGDPGLLNAFLKSYRAHYGLGGDGEAAQDTQPATPKPAG